MKLFKKSESQDEQEKPLVLKCPYCGEILSSFDGKCPYCCGEINNHKINLFIKNFIKEYNELETRRKALSDKNDIKNAIIEEKAFIETYAIENNVASIIEFLLFIKNRIISLESNRKERKRWLNVWFNKAKEAKSRGDLVSPNDEAINNEYNAIVELYEKLCTADKKRKIKILIIWLSIIAIILIIGILDRFFGFLDQLAKITS